MFMYLVLTSSFLMFLGLYYLISESHEEEKLNRIGIILFIGITIFSIMKGVKREELGYFISYALGVLSLIYVFIDSKKRKVNRANWTVLTLFTGVVGFIIYLFRRKEIKL